MITRFVRRQLVAFVLVAVVGMAFVGAQYVGLDRFFGGGGYRVSVQLASSGGIFTNAEVTYRGVPVGRVEELSLTPDGVAVQLVISSDEDIPASTAAAVSNRSAVGEQYVDLRPDTESGPFLEEGSIIPVERTSVPVPTEVLLSDVDALVRSVPLDSLQTVVTELGTAFEGGGGDLQRLLDNGNQLTAAAVEALPQTLTLIRDGRTVLDTQNEQSSSIISFSDDLRLITEQLQLSDPDLRRLITTGTATGQQLGLFLQASAGNLSQLVANLLTVTDIVAPRQDQIRTLFQVLPGIAAGGYTAVPGDGTAHFGLVLALNDPPICIAGYEGTAQLLAQEQAADPSFNDTIDEIPLNTQAYCAEPQGSPISVRGAQNAPRPDVARNDAVAAPGFETARPPGPFEGGEQLVGGAAMSLLDVLSSLLRPGSA